MLARRGIACSLGRRGISICLVDDRYSISQFSQCLVRVKGLRDEERTSNSVLEAGQRYGLMDCGLYPTRDETVAALSRDRASLVDFFLRRPQSWTRCNRHGAGKTRLLVAPVALPRIKRGKR